MPQLELLQSRGRLIHEIDGEPDVETIHKNILAALKKQGADILICGQMVIADKIDPATLTPDVTIGSEAYIVLITYQNNGYAALSF